MGPVWRLVDFERYPDLVVRVTVPTLEARALAARLVPLFTSGREQAVFEATAAMAAPFADSLVSWNARTPAGRPAPATRKGVLRVDPGVLFVVFREWFALWPTAEQPAAEPEPEVDEGLALLATLPMTPLDPGPLGDNESSTGNLSTEDAVDDRSSTSSPAVLEAVG